MKKHLPHYYIKRAFIERALPALLDCDSQLQIEIERLPGQA